MGAGAGCRAASEDPAAVAPDLALAGETLRSTQAPHVVGVVQWVVGAPVGDGSGVLGTGRARSHIDSAGRLALAVSSVSSGGLAGFLANTRGAQKSEAAVGQESARKRATAARIWAMISALGAEFGAGVGFGVRDPRQLQCQNWG